MARPRKPVSTAAPHAKAARQVTAEVKPRGPRVKTGGRQKGTTNKATKARNDAVAAALGEIVDEMTTEEIQALKPSQAMRLVMTAALQAHFYNLALSAASMLAPYVEAKLAPREADDVDNEIVVRGGLPPIKKTK